MKPLKAIQRWYYDKKYKQYQHRIEFRVDPVKDPNGYDTVLSWITNTKYAIEFFYIVSGQGVVRFQEEGDALAFKLTFPEFIS